MLKDHSGGCIVNALKLSRLELGRLLGAIAIIQARGDGDLDQGDKT